MGKFLLRDEVFVVKGCCKIKYKIKKIEIDRRD